MPRGGKGMARSAKVTARRFAAMETPVTTTIIAVNVAVFALQLLSYYFGQNAVTAALWYAPVYSLPSENLQIGSGVFQGSFEPWRMLTAMFTHSVTFLPHILFNMLALYLFGRNLEQSMGTWRFLTLYMFAGLGGSLGVMLWGYADPATVLTPTVGASGAIFGLLAATVVAFRAINANVSSLLVLLAINLGIGFMPGANVSWQAHVGGLLVGAVAMWIIVQTRGPRFQKRQVAGLVALAAVLVALSSAYLVVSPF